MYAKRRIVVFIVYFSEKGVWGVVRCNLLINTHNQAFVHVSMEGQCRDFKFLF